MRAAVGRTGAPISTAESQEERRLGLSSSPVASIFLRNEPFDEYVEGLFYFRDKSCGFTTVFTWSGAVNEPRGQSLLPGSVGVGKRF
jgi:hypothetical protein